MVGLDFLMVALGARSLWLRFRGWRFDSPAILRACFAMTPLGFAAVVFGWFTAGIGRQPWVVYGLLHRDQTVSPTIDAPTVLAPLMAFVAVHSIIFGAGTYYLFKLLRRGPDPVEDSEDENVGRAPKRPLSTLAEGLDGSSPCDASPPAE